MSEPEGWPEGCIGILWDRWGNSYPLLGTDPEVVLWLWTEDVDGE